MSVQVTCSQGVQEGKPTVRYAIKNTGTAVVHLLDGGRMPYLLRAKDGALIVLHGVNAPDPDTDYHMVEIPPTRALAAGESFERSVSLAPLLLHDHFEAEREPARLHGAVTVRCQAGWGDSAIGDAERKRLSIDKLIKWQKIAESAPLSVRLP
jgi:hypothetical protein